LPDDFKAENLEVIIKSDSEGIKSKEEKEKANEKLRSELREFYSTFNVDLSNFKFNRDELYGR
jgi:cellobiose phosphorylase